jgi:hypothetical protein
VAARTEGVLEGTPDPLCNILNTLSGGMICMICSPGIFYA